MGMQILYCAACQSQLRGKAFETGDAVRAGGKAFCKGCVPEGVQPDVLDTANETPRRGSPPSTRRSSASSSTKTQTVRESGEKPTRRWAIPSDRKSNSGLIVGGVIGGVVLLGIILAAAGSSSPAPTPAPTPPPLPAPPPVAKAAPPAPVPVTPPPSGASLEKQKTAIRALNDADAFAGENSEKVEEIARRYQEALEKARGTEEFSRAQQKFDQANRAIADLKAMAKTALDAKLRESLAKERFGELLEILSKAEAENPDPAWRREVEGLRTDYRARFREVIVPLKAEAKKAKTSGDDARVAEIRTRVASWGLSGMVTELDESLAKVKPPKKMDPAVERYRETWHEAMTRGSKGDYEGAIELLEKAASEATSPDLKKAAGTDASMMKKAMEVAVASAGAPSTWKGKTLKLRYRDPSGSFRSAEGKVEAVEDGRVVFEDGRALEEGEVALSSRLAAAEKPSEDPAAALACLLEGDAAGARTILGSLKSKTPEKYLKWKSPPLSADEKRARNIYYGALGKLNDPLTAGEGLEALATLKKEYASTRFVKRNEKAVRHAAGQGREFLIPSVRMAGAGTFSRTKTEEVAAAWVSRSDSPEADRAANYVELKFAAAPNEEYRLWMYLGACCAEVMTFTVQGTGFQEGRNGPDAVPGSEHEVPVRARVLGSRRTHVKHGGPKHPEKWYWVQIPLPEYEEGGAKTVRLLSNQKGFAVGYAFLTAAGTSPPKGTALEKRLKAQPAAAASAFRTSTGLVALYTFREGKGDVVRDVSGQEPAMDLKIGKPGAVEWLPGQGLKAKSSVKIGADSEKKLVAACKKTQELTVEAWVVPVSDDQAGPARIVTFSKDSANRVFTLGQGMSKGPNKNFQMRLQTSKSQKNGYPEFVTPQGTSTAVLTHLVYVRSADGTQLFYIDGQEISRGKKDGDFAPWNTSCQFLLANERTGDRPWLGEFHLVALYDRALTPQEVAQNFSAGAGAASTPGKSSSLKPVYREDFANGSGKFTGGALVNNGVGGSPAVAVTKHAEIWGAFETTFKPTTTVRFKVKAVGVLSKATVLVWSERLKDNAKYFVNRPPAGKWVDVEIPASELKVGPLREKGPFPTGEPFTNFKISFPQKAGVQLILDDFEILE